jgi:hypothetical protein
MVTKQQPSPPEGEQVQVDPAELERLRADAAELERLRAQGGEQAAAAAPAYQDASSPTYAVLWARISLPASDDHDDKAPKFRLPADLTAKDGFITVPRGALIAGANQAGADHLATLVTLGAVRFAS